MFKKIGFSDKEIVEMMLNDSIDSQSIKKEFKP